MSEEASQEVVSTPNFFEVFKQAVESYEQKGLQIKLKEQNDKSAYNLYEDLKILLSFAKKRNDKNTNIFKSLSQTSLSHRSQESIRSRYKDHIKNMSPTDINNILRFIVAKKGLDGFLIHAKNAQGQDEYIVSNSLKQAKSDKLKLKNTSKVLVPLDKDEEGKDKLATLLKKRHSSHRQFTKELSEPNPEAVAPKDVVSKKETTHQQHPNVQPSASENKVHKVAQVSQKIVFIIEKSSTGLSGEEYNDAKELDFYMTFLASYENVQKKSLINVLDKLSGDLNQLVEYLQTTNQNLLWKEDEDQIIQNFSEQTPQSIHLLKTLKRGKENILRRAAYLGIQLPHFD